MVFNFFNLQEVKEIFEAFDKDGSKQLDFDEFLIALRVSIESENQSVWICLLSHLQWQASLCMCMYVFISQRNTSWQNKFNPSPLDKHI